MTLEGAENLLTAAYMAEVESRHRKPMMDETTEKNIREVAEFLTARDTKFGMMFCGLCGNGKTTMLYAIQNATNYLRNIEHFDKKVWGNADIGLQIVDSRKIIQLRNKDFSQWEKLRGRFMLGIDDLGTEPTEVMDYGNILSPLVELMEYRYDRQLFTILTTNVKPKDISEKYGARLADRFNEMLRVIVFENKSYRK